MYSLLHRDRQTSLSAALGRGNSRRSHRRWAAAGVLAALLTGLFLLWGGGTGGPAALATATRARVYHAPPYHADCRAKPNVLQQDLTRIARSFNGKVGIAVAKAGCDWVVGERLGEYFPQQSVSKLWVSLTVLDTVDAGRLKLDDQLAIRPADLTLFNQPVRWEVLEMGSVTKPVQSLMKSALSLSDNTANDRLLWTVGGPDRVRAMLKEKGIEGIRFGPGERLLQSGISGISWSQELSLGRNFEEARARVPMEQRTALLERYVADPIDGAQPAGMAKALGRLATGQLLSPESTSVMMGILAKTHSGPLRLKAGAPRGWKVFHKTGTGQELQRVATGYNDVALMQAPDGTWYAVVVLIGRTTLPIPARMEMMHKVGAALGRFHQAAQR